MPKVLEIAQNFDQIFQRTKKDELVKAQKKGQIWLSIRQGLKPDLTTNQTFTEVYFKPEPQLTTGIHFFTIDDRGKENRDFMVVNDKNEHQDTLQEKIKSFVEKYYPELRGVQMNFYGDSETIREQIRVKA